MGCFLVPEIITPPGLSPPRASLVSHSPLSSSPWLLLPAHPPHHSQTQRGMSGVAWKDSPRGPIQIQLPSSCPTKAWPHHHHCFRGALLDKELWSQLSAPTSAEACRSQSGEVLCGGWVVASKWSAHRGSPQSGPSCPGKEWWCRRAGPRPPSRANLTPGHGVGRPSSNPGLALVPHWTLVFPTCTVSIRPARERRSISESLCHHPPRLDANSRVPRGRRHLPSCPSQESGQRVYKRNAKGRPVGPQGAPGPCVAPPPGPSA